MDIQNGYTAVSEQIQRLQNDLALCEGFDLATFGLVGPIARKCDVLKTLLAHAKRTKADLAEEGSEKSARYDACKCWLEECGQ